MRVQVQGTQEQFQLHKEDAAVDGMTFDDWNYGVDLGGGDTHEPVTSKTAYLRYFSVSTSMKCYVYYSTYSNFVCDALLRGLRASEN